ncbi:UDP-glucosyltransferase 2-like [Condylostylus longicornis]|uniref:UDP-glucosyltransferase 2-like n=1 Tax=Condylostylus longicornis TaxID=2530218 RepID=UPI00244E3667|nr:UDP-glucosyltransferase 2-like [Condylostylus longicornis]
MNFTHIFSLLFILLLFVTANGYKILGIFPTMAKSHFIVGSSLMKGLVDKGHEVTVISAFPQSTPLKNWRDIPTPAIVEKTKILIDNVAQKTNPWSFEVIMNLSEMGVWFAEIMLYEPAVQQLLHSNETFDLIILEIFANEAHLGFAAKFNAPIVGISAFGANIWNSDMVGNPSPPSYIPNHFVQLTDHMNLFERIKNLFVVIFERIYNDLIYLPKQKYLYETMFPGDEKPDFYELRKNVSLILLNNHFSVSFPRPLVPNMIEVGGMHIHRERKPLPNDIKEFLDEAIDGAIYFSMGSVVKSNTLPIKKLEDILRVFGSLKQRILWKWEDEELPGKSDNILIRNWFPQDDVLSHPNIKLFITHGGLLSTIEAIYHGVPILGVPVYGDQFWNTLRAEKAGLGLSVPLEDLTRENLDDAIKRILNSSIFKIKAKEVSKIYKDQPLTPLETAIFWVEYVARHKGAVHLKSGGQELSFIEYHNLDVWAIILMAFFIPLCLVQMCLRSICRKICRKNKKEEVSQKKPKKSKKQKEN